MAKLLEEKKPSNFATTLNASGQKPAEQGNFDYYENLKNESYKTLLKKEVQAAVAQDQARKYTANALNASGLGTQGIAQSTQLGIGNAYTTALNNAQNEYSQEILNINQQQRQEALNTEQAESNADYELLAGAIRNATTPEELAMIKERMAEFGFDDKSARSLNFLYELQNQQLGGSSDTTGATFDGSTFYGYDKNGKSITSTQFIAESKTLISKISVGELPKNSYVELKNSKGETCYVHYDRDGNLTFVSRDVYNGQNESNKYSINAYNDLEKGAAQKTVTTKDFDAQYPPKKGESISLALYNDKGETVYYVRNDTGFWAKVSKNEYNKSAYTKYHVDKQGNFIKD